MRFLTVCAAVLAIASGGGQLSAHPATLAAAQAVLKPDGTFTLTLRFDALAFVLNDSPDRVPDDAMLALLRLPPAELARELERARARLTRHLRVTADTGEATVATLTFPSVDDLQRMATGEIRLPVMAVCDVSGSLPAGARRVTFTFPEVIGTMVLTTEAPGQEPVTTAVSAEAASPPVMLQEPPLDSHRGTPVRTFVQLAGMGFRHILPGGWDHVLFVLGLFLLAGRLGALLWQVTAFTVAHTLTLALSLYGVVRVPAAVVEPLIALSIVLVAVDNLRRPELRWWRVVVVFGFGLVHGLGFAAALHALALSPSAFVPALLGFNAGVELGQLAVIGLAFATVGWLRAKPRYHACVVVPASAVIASIAVVWTIQRLGLWS